ncbi:hypothetical protein GCM10027614_80720 [Micromonospora vulcania]
MTVPIASSPGRNGFGPQLALGYDSGAGDGPFGLGWSLGLPAITRRTDTGIPRYDETDVYLLSGAEDLTPVLKEADDHSWVPERLSDRRVGAATYAVRRYRPRVEGLFARIERWTNVDDAADVFWRSISRDDVTTWYGRTAESRIADPADPRRIFSWLISETHDDKGDLIAYGYRAENDERVDTTLASERNRTRGANRYLKRVRYGNHRPYLPVLGPEAAWPALPGDDEWFFELVFDYGDEDGVWPARKDPFSVYRAGFEVRNHRLCQRVLMLHHFPDVPEVGAGCLVRSTDFDYSHDLLTKLTIVTQRGHQRHADGYRTRSLPPVEFGYTEAQVQESGVNWPATAWTTCRSGSTARSTAGSTWTGTGCRACSPSRAGPGSTSATAARPVWGRSRSSRPARRWRWPTARSSSTWPGTAVRTSYGSPGRFRASRSATATAGAPSPPSGPCRAWTSGIRRCGSPTSTATGSPTCWSPSRRR